MEPEFRALGVAARASAARVTDDVLDFLRRRVRGRRRRSATASRSCSCRGPRGRRSCVGGAPPHALARAARFGDGWMPIGTKPADLAPHVAQLRELFAAAGKPAPEVAVMTRLPLDDPARAADLALAYATRARPGSSTATATRTPPSSRPGRALARVAGSRDSLTS